MCVFFCYKQAIATNIPQRLKTAFVVQGHIYFLPYSVIKWIKIKVSVAYIYIDCTIITILCYYCPAVYFISSQLKVNILSIIHAKIL